MVYLPYIWLNLMVNVGKYTIHGSYGSSRSMFHNICECSWTCQVYKCPGIVPRRWFLRAFTPPKTNMSPENQWLEDVFPIKIVPFKGTFTSF